MQSSGIVRGHPSRAGCSNAPARSSMCPCSGTRPVEGSKHVLCDTSGHRECAASRMDALGRSFLAAAKSNDVAAMERYRSRQGDIHVATTDGCSALMMAALYRSEEAVEWCLQVSGPASAVCDRVRVRARVQCCAGAFVLVQSSYYNRHGWPSVPACARVWRARVHRRLCDIAAAGAVVSAAGSCMPVLRDVSV